MASTDPREIVKENAALYRDSEETRQHHEDLSHFVAQNHTPPEEENILDALAS